MLNRRSAIGLIATAAAGVISSAASACERDEPTKDMWGLRLKEFFRLGDASLLRGYLSANATLVAFETYHMGADKIAYAGPRKVEAALVALQRNLVKGTSSGPMVLKSAKLAGSGVEAGTNKITPIFGIEQVLMSSCGPTSLERGVDLFYQSEGVEPGEEYLPKLEKFAVLPVNSS